MKEQRIKILIVLMTLAVLGLVIVQVYWSMKTITTEEIRFDAKVNEAMMNVVNNIDKDKTANILIKTVVGSEDKLIWIENSKMKKDSNEVLFLSSDYSNPKMDTSCENIEVQVEISPNNEENNSERKLFKQVFRYNSENNKKVIKRSTKVDTLKLNKLNLVTEVIEEMINFEDDQHFHERISESYLDSMITMEFYNSGINTDFDFGIKNQIKDEFILIKSGAAKNKLEDSKFHIAMSPHNIFAQTLTLLIYIPNKFGHLLKSVWIMLALSLIFVGIIVVVYVKTFQMFLEQKKITEVKNDLINNITHEFKTPISSIAIATEALQEPQLRNQKGSVDKYSFIIAEENNRLTKLVENLLNTAAFERSEIELKKEKVDLNKVISDIVERSKEKNHTSKFSLLDETTEEPIIKVDFFHFTNIMNNVIDNAVKYSEKIIDISIKISNTADGIEISVSDKGIGISKSDQQKIFETFYRVPTGNIHDVKGNGIGLSYVKKIVEAHNGWVNVSSKLGVGSTFKIHLPYE